MLKDSQSTDGHAEPALGSPNGARTKGKARAVIERPPAPQGWSTTDEDEIALRRWRGSTAIADIGALEPEHPVFGSFRVRSDAGSVYEVEIRSLDAHANSCGCIDHRVNGLGTCKHIEGVLAAFGARVRWRPTPRPAIASRYSSIVASRRVPQLPGLPQTARPLRRVNGCFRS